MLPPLPAPPTLPDELLEQIFLRLPPDEPECLVRASLASKLWLGRLAAARFRGLYSDFHGAAPMLGFFLANPRVFPAEDPLFVSATKFRACIPDPGNRGYDAWDCRHGRLLLGPRDLSMPPEAFVVLDPITGCRRELDAPGRYDSFGAAVLCAVNGCDHRACHAGPSRVVFVGLDSDAVAYAKESLPETGEAGSRPSSRWSNLPSRLHRWSKQSSGLYLGPDASIKLVPPVLIKDTLYFKLEYDDDDHHHVGILKYDLCSKCLSLIDVPLVAEDIAYFTTILMGMEDGSLGFVHLDGLTLYQWSRQVGFDGVGSWTECRVIDLKEVLPFPMERLKLAGSMEGGDIIFVTMRLGTYEINLKSLDWKKISKEECSRTLIPYTSFYYPQERANPCDVVH